MAEPSALPIVANEVLVNKTGGITVSGTLDCAAAVNAYDWSGLGGSLGNPPANLTILVNVSWTAYQPVGRKTMLQATFGSDHKDPCYNTYADPNYGPVCGGDTGSSCRWITSNYTSTSTPVYVYSPQGKFAPGAIHVDVSSAEPDGYVLIDGNQQCELGGAPSSCEIEGANPMTLNIFQRSGYDLKATRAH
jgi:hypothetical protein